VNLRSRHYGDATVWVDENGLWVGAQGTAFPAIGDPQIRPPAGAFFWRTDFAAWYSWDRLTQSWVVVGSGGTPLTVEELDGSPSVTAVDKIQFDQADGFVVADGGSGDAQVGLTFLPRVILGTGGGSEPAVLVNEPPTTTAIWSEAASDNTVFRRASGTLTWGSVATDMYADNSVTYAKIQDVTAESRLLGRGQGAGSGDPQEITLGAGLSMSGTSLSASAAPAPDGDARILSLMGL